ncbi:DUF2461 domain-containing protein [Actinocrispum sp. NPDC049592]|uniref:DUF2461 domain-containing protein n=1 Tax=Actinocrispum sp. NPDC049592 TaxID=3154835 RepID=UPI003423098C
MSFTGFGEYAIDFFDGLVLDNTKAYWDDNRDTYNADVRAPMEALLAELVGEFGTDFGEAKVFRPYRDVRFAKDKTPYKTHCGGVIEQGRGGGAYYVQIGPEGLRVGGGCFHLEADQIARFRAAIAEDIHGSVLEKLIAKLTKQGWDILGERLKTRPKGYEADHPRIELLKHKSLYAARSWEPGDFLHERECLTRVRKAWRELKALNTWARDHVGVSLRSAS